MKSGGARSGARRERVSRLCCSSACAGPRALLLVVTLLGERDKAAGEVVLQERLSASGAGCGARRPAAPCASCGEKVSGKVVRVA